MSMGFLGLLLLVSGDFLVRFLNAPPRDLAALVQPQVVLQQAGVEVKEDVLIALVEVPKKDVLDHAALALAAADLGAEAYQVRQRAVETLRKAGAAAKPYLEKASTSDDPEIRLTVAELLRALKKAKAPSDEGDRTYVKRLLAIRMLEQLRSRKALPALRQVAAGADLTLADAARQAMALIQGAGAPAVAARRAADEVSGMVSENVGFIALLDISRGRQDGTLRQYVEAALKDKDPRSLGVRDPSHLDQWLGRMEKGVVAIIARCGNARVDWVAMVTSGDLGAERRRGYVAWVFKGFWDPARLRKACAQAMRQQMTVGERVVFHNGHGPAVCIFDERTAVISIGDGRDGEHMRQFLEELPARGKGRIPAHAGPALKMVAGGQVRLAASGALSDGQRAELRREIQQEIQRIEQRIQQGRKRGDTDLILAACRMLLDLTGVDAFSAHVGPGGKLIAQARCPENAPAAALHKSLTTVEQHMRDMIAKQMSNQMPPQVRALFGNLEQGGALWQTTLKGNAVTATADLGLGGAFLMLMGLRLPAR